MAPLASPLFLPSSDDGLRALTRLPLLRVEEERRIALDIEDARRRLFEALDGCPEAAPLRTCDVRNVNLASAIERIADPARRATLRDLERRFSQAVGRLALPNTRLAVSIAKRYLHRGLPLTDLVQEALLGLLRAARRFEPRRGLRFSTSATWWIRQAVVLALQERGRLVRIPARALESLGRVRRTRAALEQTLGREPSIEEIADGSGLPLRKTLALTALQAAPLSLDQGASEDRTLLDSLPDAAEPEPLQEDLRKLMVPLNDRERTIMTRRYGTDGQAPETLEQIGARLGLTRERVRQIEKKAMEKLRYAVHLPSSAPTP